MPVKPNPWLLGALLCIGAASLASAQTVYKCTGRRSVTYTEQPCSKRTVTTDPAAAPVKPLEVRRMEQNRALARVMRPREGETVAQFETRRRRVLLTPADRAECGRLDTRIPVEEASLTNPDPAEVLKSEVALKESRKRFSDLRC